MKIFLIVLFTCFITVSAVLFAGAKASTGHSMADASLKLAGRSVLAEYDRQLLSDYGLLAIRGEENWIEDAIVYYAEASLAPKTLLYSPFRSGSQRTISQNAYCEDILVSLKEYSLLDVDNFEDQIRAAAVSEIFKSIISGKERKGGSANGKTEREDGYGRVLRNSGVISSLPSAGFEGPLFPSFGALSDIPKLEDVIDAGTAMFTVSEYILSVFGNHVDGAKEDHFFGNEVEYIIAGKYDDDANYQSIKYRLGAIRFALNNVALMTDSKKMAIVEEIALVAAAATGGSLYEVIKISVMEAWVAAETGNDLMLLEQGDKVALVKTPSQWATFNIAEIWAGWTSSKPTYAANGSGQSYRDYLRLMLYVLDRETKVLRIMDLVQINMKGTYYGEFLIREHYVGFRFWCRVSGEYYAYREKY